MVRLTSRFLIAVAFLLPLPLMATGEKLVVKAEFAREGEFIAFGYDALWMMKGHNLVRVAAADNSVTDTVIEGTTGEFRGVAVGEGAVWIPDSGARRVFKVDPATRKVVSSFDAAMFGFQGSIGVGDGSVWIVTVGKPPVLTRFSAATGAEEASIPLPAAGFGVVAAHGSVWLTSPNKNVVYRVDAKTNALVATIPVGKQPRFIASGEDSIWVFNKGDGSVQRIDGKTGAVVATIDAKLRGLNGDIAVGGGYVWVSVNILTVGQIDPTTNTLVRRFDSESFLQVRYGAGSLWGSGTVIRRTEAPH